jgi:hypothetical protein
MTKKDSLPDLPVLGCSAGGQVRDMAVAAAADLLARGVQYLTPPSASAPSNITPADPKKPPVPRPDNNGP